LMETSVRPVALLQDFECGFLPRDITYKSLMETSVRPVALLQDFECGFLPLRYNL
jgi:hypothetical protein